MVNPFRLGTAARRWVPALATALAVAGAVPTGAAATSITGTIVVIQDTVPDDPQDFRFNVAGSEFVLDDDAATSIPSLTPNQSTISDVAPGYQALAQDPVAGWDLTNVSCQDPDGGTFTTQTGATVDVDPGETITCTITNAARGNVVIHLDAQPDDPAPIDFVADWGSFTLNDDGSDADFLWPDMTVEGLLPGTYAIAEQYSDALELSDIACSDPDGGTTTGQFGDASLDVDAGETIECTFTNVPRAPTPRASLDVVLNAVPDDGADVAFAFVGLPVAFSLDDDADPTLPSIAEFSDLDPGTITVAATLPTGWRVKSLACADPDGGSTTNTAKAQVTADLDDGESVTCTFTIEPIPVAPPPGPLPTCNGKTATIVGAPGATVRGTQGPDVIVALSGDVRVDGRGGNDTICTGPGSDIVNGGAGDDWIDAGDGVNTADGGAGHDVIRAGSGNDTLLGDGGNDRVDGGDGNNLVSTGSGDDQIVTGSGDDRIDGGKDFDTCQSGTGHDSVNRCEG